MAYGIDASQESCVNERMYAGKAWRVELPKKYLKDYNFWQKISNIYEAASSRKIGIKRVIEYIKGA